ncbi:glutaredoxin-1 [Salvelinus alpinus]|uniref:glutaredoxin-1 n=1 Tax=Salvelinus alpinus TaxID=8036 RepID=UPI0039FBDA65
MAQEFVETKLRVDRVTIFLKPLCPYCVTAKEILSKYTFKAGHLEFRITGRRDMSSLQDYFLEITGARTVPRVFIGEEYVGGCSEVAELGESGKLEGMLQSIGALQ